MLKNSVAEYGLLAKIFHWLMAFMIIFMLALGLIMVDLPIGIEKFKYYGLHKSIGVLILFLAAFRLLWRLFNITPSMKNTPKIQQILAHLVHFSLYGAMFALPMSGWVLSSSVGFSVSFFGLFTLPNLVGASEGIHKIASVTHELLAYCLIAALVAHIGAALLHHFYHKDNTLKKML